MISLKVFQSLQAKSIVLKLTLRFLRQEQSFSNSQFQDRFCHFVQDVVNQKN